MTNDTSAPRNPDRDAEEIDETIPDDPAYDPAKQALVPEESDGAVRDMVDVEHQEEAVYDLEDDKG